MGQKSWNMVADVGGTNARFGLQDAGSSELCFSAHYSVDQHQAFSDAMGQFLRRVEQEGCWRNLPEGACLAVAAPTDCDVIHFTNSPWAIHRRHVSEQLRAPVDLLNDFAAVGYAITDLQPRHWRQLGGSRPRPDRPIAVLGPGTGLGMCTVVPVAAGFKVLDGEGGHIDFAPVDELESEVLAFLRQSLTRVSVERLLSGAGIVRLYRALAAIKGTPPALDQAVLISEAALNGADPLAVQALELFCRILGSAAGNLALTVGAKGGVYIAGGIVPRFVDFLAASDFRARFEAKGRFEKYLRDIPLRVVLKDDLGLVGAAKYLLLARAS